MNLIKENIKKSTIILKKFCERKLTYIWLIVTIF
jgi:hypothetical protein